MDNSYRTAIVRKKPSLPLRVLMGQWRIKSGDRILDFGCGRGTDYLWLQSKGYDARGYDPHWQSYRGPLDFKYDKVLCTYVLNVVEPKERPEIIKQLKNLTNDHGKVYITVRRDMKQDYVTSQGVHQYLVYLPYKIIKETSAYCIYEINKDDK